MMTYILQNILYHIRWDEKVISEIHQLKVDRLSEEVIQLEGIIAKLKGYKSREDAIMSEGHDVFKGADV